jgi:SecD/SecF fusion protein
LSALLADGKDSATTKRKQSLDKIIAQGGGPVLGLFSPKDNATNGYFKDKMLKIY